MKGKKERPTENSAINEEKNSSDLKQERINKEDEEIEGLLRRLEENTPESGVMIKKSDPDPFAEMPLSSRTLKGLALGQLINATEIQTAVIPHALAGRDILAAAKTGSGKTLAFVIPVLEKLYTQRWGYGDGLAALIITPTRELALQIFEVIRIVGRKHQFSAGLITGGKKEFEGEQSRIVGMNILVATPGRLLQHFEQTPNFDASSLLLLVLDEADRILDMGFQNQLDSVLNYLPSHRQTMLFSATQTKSVKDLARLSLQSPEYISVHAEDEIVTPKQLLQNYVVCKLTEKLDILFSFIKAHLKSKMIVFFATCSQVRYVYELFRGMQPGTVLTALHGKIKQDRRTIIFMDFVKRKSACMFATDIAARGLDFPDVDWVIQVDAPEDNAMYIHRVGRTARYVAGGRALLMLLPHEEKPVVGSLQEAGIPIHKLTVNTKFKVSVAARAAALLAAQPDWKILAKKSFCGYLRSIQMVSNYTHGVDLKLLDIDNYATSLGLPFTPDVPVIQNEKMKEDLREKKNVNRSLDKLRTQIKEAKMKKRREKLMAKLIAEGASQEEAEEILKDVLGESSSEMKTSNKSDLKQRKLDGDDNEDEEDNTDDLFTVKKVGTHEKFDNLGSSVSSTATSSGNNVFSTSSKTGSVGVSQELMKKKQKQEKLKINLSGEGKVRGRTVEDIEGSLMESTSSKQKGKKIVFDDNGDAKDTELRLQSWKVLESNQSDENGKGLHTSMKMKAHVSKVQERLDKGRLEDEEREKQRIQALHREERRKRKGLKRKADDEDENDDGNGVVLAGYDNENSDTEGAMMMEEDLENQDDFDDEDISSKSLKNKKSKNDKASKKNKKRRKLDSNDEMDEVDDHGDVGQVDLDAVRRQEELVMKLLN